MARRVIHDGGLTTVDEERVVEHVPISLIIANVITAVYALVIGLIGLDALLQAMNAREDAAFVSFIRTVTDPLLAPFSGMFDHQAYWATALVAAIVYTLAYLVLTVVLRRDRGTTLV